MARSRRQRGDSRAVRRLRIALTAVVGLIALGVVGAGIWTAVQPAPTDLESGEHYTTLADAPPPQGPVTVREFFSYACIHCRRFEPQLNAWLEELPTDVRFARTPVTFSGEWRALAQAYYALRELDALEANHERIFRAIHDQGRRLGSVEDIADFVDGHGTDRDAFLRATRSPAVRRAVTEAMERARRVRVTGVPTLVVDERYRIGVGELSRRQMLAVAEHLIEKARQLREPPTAAAASE